MSETRQDATPEVVQSETLGSLQRGAGVEGSVPQNLPELSDGLVPAREIRKPDHSQEKTHSRNAEEALKPTPIPAQQSEERRER